MADSTSDQTAFCRSVLTKKRVLVLDGETRTALAVVRSLSSRGMEVIVAASSRCALAQSSKHSAINLISPDPHTVPDGYREWLCETVQQWRPDVLLPLTDLSVGLCLSSEAKLRQWTSLPFVNEETFAAVSDKSQLMQIAQRLGISTPRSLLIPEADKRSADDLAQIKGFSYPAVLKPSDAVVQTLGGVLDVPVFYPENFAQVMEVIDGSIDIAHRLTPFLLQEKVQGVGTGVFALCHQGRILASFCHKRLLEKPPSGGVSVLCESISQEQAPFACAAKLLEHFSWDGAAMVEFKKTAAGEHYLLEINPRFWGSLQLAIDCGRDFPFLLCLLSQCKAEGELAALAEYCQRLPEYKTGLRLRWLLGTVDHALILLKNNPRRFVREVLGNNSLQFFRKFSATRLEVCRTDDIKPFFAELYNWFAACVTGN
jgi:predicted ATP-grasp superfamily ATP-dependent carboligase